MTQGMERSETKAKTRCAVVVMRPRAQHEEVCGAVREATTGAVVMSLPRVWAVADAKTAVEPTAASARRKAPEPELAFYRKYTEAMLGRYVRMSLEAGRVPSLIGRDMFRGRVTSYRVHSFEDVVIFCYDVEKCLAELDALEQQLIRRVALQEYTQGEAASMLGMSLRTCVRRYGQAVDHLTAIFLRMRLLEPLRSCQGVE